MSSPRSQYSVGIIGLGTVGARFVEQFGQHPDFEVSAGWDAAESARARFASVIPVMDSPLDVIESCDVVYIAVPPAAHGAYVSMAVNAGVGIFCEKPLGVDAQESQEMVEAVENSQIAGGVNFVFASAPAAVRMGEAIRNGELGEISRIEIRLHFPQWPRPWQHEAKWLAAAAEGGWTREVGSHFLFLVQRYCGDLHLRYRYVDRPVDDLAERRVIAHLEAGSTEVLLTGSSASAGPEIVECTVHGTQKSLRLRNWYSLEYCSHPDFADPASAGLDFVGPDSEWLAVPETNDPNPAPAAYRAQLDQLKLMLDGQPHHLATFAEALGVQNCVEEILQR
jgi:predicted dehydrogenase